MTRTSSNCWKLFLESNVPAFSQRSEDFKKVFTAFGETFKRKLSKLPSGNIPSSAALVLAANKINPTRIDLDKATDALATAWTALDDTLTRLLRLVGESGLAEHGKELKEMFSGLSRSMNNMDFGGMNQQVQMLSAMSRTMRPAASDLIGSPSRFIHRRSGRMLFPTCEDPSAIAPNRTPSRGSPTEAQQRADHRDKGFSTRKARAVLRRQPVRRSPQWQGVGMPSERTS